MSLFEHIEDKEAREKAEAAHESAMLELKDSLKNEMQTQIQQSVEEATAGLKNKNKQLLDEKKRIAETLKNFDNIDIDKAKEALRFLDENEDAQLLKDGKIDELLERRTSQMRSDHEAKTQELSDALNQAKEHGTMFESLYKTKMVEDSLREEAIKAKVRPEAINDILLRGKTIFSLGEDGTVEARTPDGKLAKTPDDKVLTTSNWMEGLKKESPHYWMPSNSANAFRNLGSSGDMTEALAKAAQEGDMVTYRKLREQQKA